VAKRQCGKYAVTAAANAWDMTNFRMFRSSRHCERSEAIHQAAKKVWIALLRSK
jgi:hypothetical protein